METRKGNDCIVSDFDSWKSFLVEAGRTNEKAELISIVDQKFVPCAIVYGRANDTWRMKDKTNIGPYYELAKFMKQFSNEDYFQFRLVFYVRTPDIAIKAAQHLNLDSDAVEQYFNLKV